MESLAHILVVDDHREIRDLLAKYLAKHGFRVSAAESAAKARRLLEASGGRVMPGTCGRTCTRWSRGCSSTRVGQVLTEPREGCFYREIGNRWPVMPSTHAGTA